MITDKYIVKRSFPDAKKKSLSPTSNSKIHHLNSNIEQSDLSSLNSLNKNEHWKSASKINFHSFYALIKNESGHKFDHEAQRNFANGRVPSKNQQF
jgi:hypothetical protein